LRAVGAGRAPNAERATTHAHASRDEQPAARMDAVTELAPTVGVQAACRALGVPRATFYRQRWRAAGACTERAAPPAAVPPATASAASPATAVAGDAARPHPRA